MNMDINRNYRVDSAPRLTDWTTSSLMLMMMMMMMWSLSTAPAVRIMIWIVMHEIETNSCDAARRIIDTTASSGGVVIIVAMVVAVGSKRHGIFLHRHAWP